MKTASDWLEHEACCRRLSRHSVNYSCGQIRQELLRSRIGGASSTGQESTQKKKKKREKKRDKPESIHGKWIASIHSQIGQERVCTVQIVEQFEAKVIPSFFLCHWGVRGWIHCDFYTFRKRVGLGWKLNSSCLISDLTAGYRWRGN